MTLGNHYDYVKHVEERIKAGDSPDVIVHALKRENKWTVSTSTLYRYIENGYIPGITSKDLLEKPTRKPRKHSDRLKGSLRVFCKYTIKSANDRLARFIPKLHYNLKSGFSLSQDEDGLLLALRLTYDGILLPMTEGFTGTDF